MKTILTTHYLRLKRLDKQIIFAIGLSFLMFSCEERNSSYFEALEFLSEKIDSSKYNYVLFIPYRGCGGCVGTTINFLKANSSNDVLKVFYDFNSLKDLKIRMGLDLEKDTFIDHEERLFKIIGPTLYPAILNLRINKSEAIQIIDPFKSSTFWQGFAQRGTGH